MTKLRAQGPLYARRVTPEDEYVKTIHNAYAGNLSYHGVSYMRIHCIYMFLRLVARALKPGGKGRHHGILEGENADFQAD